MAAPRHGTIAVAAPASPLAVRLALVFVLLASYTGWFLADTSQASFQAFATPTKLEQLGLPPAYPGGYMTPYRAVEARTLAEDVATEIAAGHVDAVHHQTTGMKAGRLLLCDVYARGRGGAPVQDARVVFHVISPSGTVARTVYTNADGLARTRVLVRRSDRGKPVVVAVSVYTKTWSNSDYSWFVPK